jgi:hypothetical protein
VPERERERERELASLFLFVQSISVRLDSGFPNSHFLLFLFFCFPSFGLVTCEAPLVCIRASREANLLVAERRARLRFVDRVSFRKPTAFFSERRVHPVVFF